MRWVKKAEFRMRWKLWVNNFKVTSGKEKSAESMKGPKSLLLISRSGRLVTFLEIGAFHWTSSSETLNAFIIFPTLS